MRAATRGRGHKGADWPVAKTEGKLCGEVATCWRTSRAFLIRTRTGRFTSAYIVFITQNICHFVYNVLLGMPVYPAFLPTLSRAAAISASPQTFDQSLVYETQVRQQIEISG
jgi:hypothetical protein